MKHAIRTLRKALIFLIGIFVVALGIILIPLPGPGLLVIVGGLVILSFEFEWAQKYLDRAKDQIKKVYEKSKK